MGKQIGSGPDLFVRSPVVLLHQSVQSIPERGVQEWSGEKVMACYFLILLTSNVLNGNNWK